ncbi:MAG: hypothetical protein RMJ86_08515 [Anaerolineae bacterium]|nr:hypothetical protein [Thermoflexales bacterium]MDW8054573.1 hypothetical protein [Anaerolineae bacterium]
MVEKRYPILRVLAVLLKVVGIIFGVFTLFGTLGACLAGALAGSLSGNLGESFGFGDFGQLGVLGGLLLGLYVLFIGGILTISLLASGEQIDVLIALEENSRAIRLMMEDQRRAAQPATAPPTPSFTPSITPRPAPPSTPSSPTA